MTTPKNRKCKSSISGKDSSVSLDVNQINSKELDQIPLQERECQHIINQVSERLACFTILGFDYAGNSVSISVVQNQLQDLALTSLVSNFYDRLNMSRFSAENDQDQDQI